MKHLHIILFQLAFGVTPCTQACGADVDVAKGRKGVGRKFEIGIHARNDVITAARQFYRLGIDDNFMSHMKRGKLTYLANVRKIRADKADWPRSHDGTEEDAVKDDIRRWTEALVEVDEVLNKKSNESDFEDGSMVPEADGKVDSDADPDDEAWYDSE